MKTKSMATNWAEQWLAKVEDGTLTMSQRTLNSIGKHGGLASLRKQAKSKRLHLLLITDDKGTPLVAASKTPFKVVC